MLLLGCRGIKISYGNLDVLKGIDLDINEGERIGLVGRNGAGKTTLAGLIFGNLQPDNGSFLWGKPKVRTGFLTQSSEYLLSIRDGDDSIAAGTGSEIDMARMAYHLGIAGIQKWDAGRLGGLSGGERTKLALSSILAYKPELLILDEPTNHLDFKGTEWLAAELAKYKGTVLAISHDRYFLDMTADRIVEIENGTAASYSGNYSFYRKEKKRESENLLHLYTEQEKRKDMIEAEIVRVKRWSAKSHRDAGKTGKMAENKMGGKEFYRIAAKKMDKRVNSKIKRLKRLEEDGIIKPEAEASLSFMFNNTDKHGKRILEAVDLKKEYSGRILFKNTSFFMLHGDKIGLIGPNGCGKSTLLKIILGEEHADSGKLWLSPTAEVSYLSQDVVDLESGKKPLEILGVLPGVYSEKARNVLASLGIGGRMMDKTIENLSMGERMRIKLAAAILEGKAFLILDEPANHLDLYSRERLEDALCEYEGTLLLVSHDRYMLEKVCGKLLVFMKDRIVSFQGTFNEYLMKEAEEKSVLSRGINLEEEKLLLENRSIRLLGQLTKLSKEDPEYLALDMEFKAMTVRKRELGM
jgi:macrolide transport system ATP-binding/permease protein